MRALTTLMLALVLISALAGCGKKGPLTLPQADTDEAQPE